MVCHVGYYAIECQPEWHMESPLLQYRLRLKVWSLDIPSPGARGNLKRQQPGGLNFLKVKVLRSTHWHNSGLPRVPDTDATGTGRLQ